MKSKFRTYIALTMTFFVMGVSTNDGKIVVNLILSGFFGCARNSSLRDIRYPRMANLLAAYDSANLPEITFTSLKYLQFYHFKLGASINYVTQNGSDVT